MSYAGLDLCRKRLDFHLLDREGVTVEVGAALHLEGLPAVMSEHEDRVVVRRVLSPNPVHGSGAHGPGPPPNMLRPMTVAPMFSNQPSTIGVPALTSPPRPRRGPWVHGRGWGCSS
jgi:hypothetical protein